MARKRSAKAPKLDNGSQESQAVPDASEREQQGAITKAEAARRAIAAGHNKPQAAVAYGTIGRAWAACSEVLQAVLDVFEARDDVLHPRRFQPERGHLDSSRPAP